MNKCLHLREKLNIRLSSIFTVNEFFRFQLLSILLNVNYYITSFEFSVLTNPWDFYFSVVDFLSSFFLLFLRLVLCWLSLSLHTLSSQEDLHSLQPFDCFFSQRPIKDGANLNLFCLRRPGIFQQPSMVGRLGQINVAPTLRELYCISNSHVADLIASLFFLSS